MLMQGFLVAILLGLAVGRDLTFLVRHLIRQQTVQGASSGFSLVSGTGFKRVHYGVFASARLAVLWPGIRFSTCGV